jgi:hypothetical protein
VTACGYGIGVGQSAAGGVHGFPSELTSFIGRAAGVLPRYLNIQRLNYLWTIRHSSARIAGNLVT